MKTVKEVSKLTRVSIRTLHYYDAIGLLHPTDMTESGCRLYDDIALERLQSILLFRELQFLLKEIKEFGTSKIDEYARQAKESWGKTEAYKDFEEKNLNLTDEEKTDISKEFMALFAEFGAMKNLNPSDERVRAQVDKLRNYITEHFYNCTIEILQGLGAMYSGGGSMSEI